MFRSVHLVKDDPKRMKWVEKGRKSRVSKVHCRSLVQNSLSGSQDQMILLEPRHSAQRADLAHFPKCRIYSTFIETRLFARTPMRVILFLLFIGLALAACNNSNRGETKDRKSTRLNSSHVKISYAVFCLKKKTKNK